MYEAKNSPLISRAKFRRRLIVHMLMALGILLLSLTVGVAGHMYFDGMGLVSAVVASTTMMSGLGLSILPDSVSGQLFASLYGIFCGYIYVATSGIIIAPLLHRMLHKFHIAVDD
jgi:hypothetical protein